MLCQGCKHENPRGSKFCVFCGSAFPEPAALTRCQSCGHDAQSGFKFCPYCGHTLGKKPEYKFCLRCGGALDNPTATQPICGKCSASAMFSATCLLCGNAAENMGLCAEHAKTHQICPLCRNAAEKRFRFCPGCRAMWQLPRDFLLSTNDYEYKGDREAMNSLRSIKTLNVAVEQLSKKFGKTWLESRFKGGGIKVSSSQFPRIEKLALLAARVMGLRQLPVIYISGDIAWSSDTYGTESDAFIVLGSFLTKSLNDLELLFILSHEMAHVKSGHAMYRTVAQVLAGHSGPRGVMGEGFLGLLDFQKLVSRSIELPLLAWIRESEVTGDCAGLIVVRNLEVARKVLLLQALRSPDLYNELNLEAYLKQQEEAENQIGKLSEFLSQSTPYVSRRIRFLNEFAVSNQFIAVTKRMQGSKDLTPELRYIRKITDQGSAPQDSETHHIPPPGKGEHGPEDSRIKGVCPFCNASFSVAKKLLPEKGKIQFRCKKCGKIFEPRPPGGKPDPLHTAADDKHLRGSCPHCETAYSVERKKLPEKGAYHLRCKRCGKTFPQKP